MYMGFWETLPRPILALAPMANVTDAAFRHIIAKYGKFTRPDGARGGGPAVIFTEFVSADGLMSAGRAKLLVDLMYSESERPIVAQLFSGNPEKMFEAAKLVRELGFDGLDINMGCPDRAIEKSGAGAALIKNPRLAREIIRAAKAGLMYCTSKMYSTSEIPISVKTRLGYHKDILEEWLPELLAEKPAAITLHARTRAEMSKVPAHWERVKRAVEIRDDFTRHLDHRALDPVVKVDPNSAHKRRAFPSRCWVKTLILGNGDVMSIAEARQRAKETGADGCLLGRAIFGNPWLFSGGKRSNLSPDLRFDLEEPLLKERLRVMVEHTKLFEKLLGENKNFAIMKKHFKAYVQGFDGAKELRMELMTTENASQVEKIAADFRNSTKD